MRQGDDTIGKFVEKVVDAISQIFNLEVGQKLSPEQFDDVEAVVLGGADTVARDHLVHVNPTDVKALTNTAITAAFLEKSGKRSHGNAVRDGKLGEMVTAVTQLRNEIDDLRGRQSAPIQVKPKTKNNKVSKPGMNDLIGALAQFTAANTSPFQP